jgi:hypothetical protein
MENLLTLVDAEDGSAAGGSGGAAGGASERDGGPAEFRHGRQLFVISPKLLPDLSHMRTMRTHVVFNGPRLVDPSSVGRFFCDFQRIAQSSALSIPSYFGGSKGAAGGAGGGGAKVGSKRPAPAQVLDIDDDEEDDEGSAHRDKRVKA